MSVRSMTGFSSVEGQVGSSRIRVEIKTLNHRFLDLKIRLPREYSSAEMPLRALLSQSFSRGSLELKVERITDPSAPKSDAVSVNLELASNYFSALKDLQNRLGLTDSIRTKDVAAFPDVINKGSNELDSATAWAALEPWIKQAIQKNLEMRAHEGAALTRVLTTTLDELATAIAQLRKRREELVAKARSQTHAKIQEVFAAHPIKETSIASVLESRIAQELALILDRSDIEEELVRFSGHIEHARKVIREGNQVGRKLEFILQELNREMNTLSNKSQDLGISETAVHLKIRIEQMREQALNLE